MKIKRWIVGALVLCLLAGCNQQSIGEAKAEASKNWQHTQSQVLCSVAGEHLKAGQLDKAQEKAIEALSLEPSSYEARVLLAKAYIEEGRYSAAANELGMVCAKQLPAQNASEPVYLLAVAHEKEGKLADALAEYRKAYAMDNNNIPALAASVEVLVAMGNLTDAQATTDAYLSQSTDDPTMCELAGRVAAMQKNYAKALKCYQQAHDLDYKNTLYVECIAKTLFAMGQYSQAIETLKSLTQQDRKALWIHRMLGDSYLCVNRPADARDEFQLIVDQNPDDASAWISLGKAALAGGDPQRAIFSCDQALKIEPSNLDAMLVQGYSLMLNGDNQRAMMVLGNAAIAHPASSTALCLLGKAHAASGQDSQALKCYTDALRLEPGNKLARGMLAMAQQKAGSQ
jgi:tetratricopeptide (TPR) repeat protein